MISLPRLWLTLAGLAGLLGLAAAAAAPASATTLRTGVTPAASAASAASTASAAGRFVRIGTAPVLPAGTQPLAAASSNQRLRVAVALEPRHPAALAAYASEVADPSSPHYREFLSTAEFAAFYGASRPTIDAVRSTLRREGLRVGALSANHLSFDIVADAGTFERAMHLQLAHVELPDKHAALVDIEAPAVPAAIAPDIQAVVGLDGMATMHSLRSRDGDRSGAASAATSPAAGARVTTAPAGARSVKPAATEHQPTACATASSTAASEDAYTDPQIAQAYNFTPLYDSGDEGAGVTIGVYELEPNLTSDIAAYQSCYGTDTSVTYQQVDGGAGSGAGSGEAAFDIEQLIGFAPEAKLIVYQAPNSNSDNPGSGPYDLFAKMISDDAVSVISNSWGECESEEGATDAHAENTLFEEAAIQGQTVLSAAGDDGSEDCYGSTDVGASALAVDDPGSQPFVTDVGGTSLTAIGSPNTEVVWNGGGNGVADLGSGAGAGGGGISDFWPMPSYQSAAASSLGVVNGDSTGENCDDPTGDCREVPDVSADADPAHGYLIYYNGNGSEAGQPEGWQSSGGTSGAAPLWAALIADTDADSACDRQPVGFVNPALYAAADDAQTTYFHDITSGNNDYTGAHKGLYPATPGYDMASGLGTPNAAGLAGVLCQDSLRLAAPASTAVFTGAPLKLDLRTADAAGVAVTVAVSGLPAGVSYDAATGEISGTPTAAGVHEVTVTATDANGAVRTATFVLDVAAKPTLSHLSLTQLTTAKPVASLRLTAGKAEADLSRVAIELPAGLSAKQSAKISVVALSGAKAIAHHISVKGRRLTITLTTPSTPVVVRFASGALGDSARLRRAAAGSRKPKLAFSVVVKDTSGLVSTARGSVRPTT